MPSSPSPPEEAEHIRHQKLTPESPKPVHYPSPSNIPILQVEKQMDPVFNEPAPSQYPQQTPTPSANESSAASSYFAAHAPHHQHPHPHPHPHQQQQAASSYQNVGAHGHLGAAPAAYPHQAAAYIAGMGTQTQDTSMHNFSAQQQSPASSISDTKPAPGQDLHAAYPFSHDSLYAAATAAAQQAQAQAPGNQFQAHASAIAAMAAAAASAGSTVDVQALLETLSPSAINSASDRFAAASIASSQLTPQPSQAQGNASTTSLPAAPGLPPRPPAQEKPATHPNYNPNDDIRSYHPHSQKPAAATQLRGNGQHQSLPISPQGFPAASAPTTRSGQSPTTPGYGQRQSGQRSETPDDEDIRWPPEINKLYEEFLDQERKFVTEGQWDQFPLGSRLFIGNLPTEKVTKRDIFHRFFRHGKLAQISIKQAYGFVQFLDSESCRRALDAEQGQAVRGRKMHLEVSKPQRNTKKAADPPNNDRNSGARRRSRSPDYTRGGTGPVPRNDRYSGNQNPLSPRDRENRRFRDRDDYRPMRSPSPRGGPRGGRGRERSRDRYDTRWRSRSRSPRRYRSPSPRRDFDDDLGLPRRAPHEVPDVQILVINEELPRDFIRWVEETFRSQGLRINVLIMSARLSEEAVVRRQILEGVLAIVRLDTTTLVKSKVNVQIFDRRGGANNVQFNEYADLDPTTAAALVNNAKQTHSTGQVQPPYGYNQTMPSLPRAPQNQYTPMTAGTPNISSLISSLDPGSLSQLLGAMAGNNAAQNPQPTAPGIHPDLARLLASVSTPSSTPAYRTPAQAPQSIADQYPALASLLAGATQQGQQIAPPVQTPTQAAPPPDMNEIMAQLAKYNPNQR